MKVAKQIAFWLLALLAMTFIYQSLLGGFVASLTLASLLLPGAALMSAGIRYWRNSSSSWRWLHLLYLLVFSLYLEWLAMIIAYWLIFEMQFQDLPKVLVNPVFLWLYMLFFALLEDFIWKKELVKIEEVKVSYQPLWFEIVSSRQRKQIDLNKLQYIESRDEQTLFYIEGEQWPCRERISQLESRLPKGFLRIHRSYIINPSLALSIHTSRVQMPQMELTVSRSYKQRVASYLDEQGSIDN
jgi:hypothetical protein